VPILAELVEPGSAASLAPRMGLARQKVNYHLRALEAHGLGVGSSRVFTGTREIHRDLEQAIARFLQVPDAIVLGSGYLANIGFYEALFDSRDCLFCDALVHPSTAEGIRLSSATAFPFHNNDVEDLEDKLRRSRSARFRAIATDDVFPFDGCVAERPVRDRARLLAHHRDLRHDVHRHPPGVEQGGDVGVAGDVLERLEAMGDAADAAVAVVLGDGAERLLRGLHPEHAPGGDAPGAAVGRG